MEGNGKASKHLAMETNLRHALDREEFLLHYQPLIDMKNGRVIALSPDPTAVLARALVFGASVENLWKVRLLVACPLLLFLARQYPPIPVASDLSALSSSLISAHPDEESLSAMPEFQSR